MEAPRGRSPAVVRVVPSDPQLPSLVLIATLTSRRGPSGAGSEPRRVGDRRVHRAARRVARTQHEVVDQQLRAAVERLREHLRAVRRMQRVLRLDRPPRKLPALPCQLVAHPGVFLLALEQHGAGGTALLARRRSGAWSSSSWLRMLLHAAIGAAATSVAFWRSISLTAPVRQPSARVADIGSGKMSSSPARTASKIAPATDSADAFGTANSRDLSVSIGPASTAWTLTPRAARSARSDCDSDNDAAFETE